MSCIIVMGCFRSGTSAVAGTLHHLGVFMGDRFDIPNRNNPKGFWEDLDFKSLHSAYDDSQNVVDLDKSYRELVEKRESAHKLWGVKDPLICKYLHKLTAMIEDHKLIVCRRSVEEIADSMGRVIGIPDPEMFLPLANSYVDELNKSLSEYTGPVLEVQKTDSMISILEPICDFTRLPKNQAAIDFLSNTCSEQPQVH